MAHKFREHDFCENCRSIKRSERHPDLKTIPGGEGDVVNVRKAEKN